MKRSLIALASVATVGASAFAVRAGTLTATMSVGITTVPACSSFSATALDFGTVVNGSSNVTASAPITVTCTNGAAYSVLLNVGQHPFNAGQGFPVLRSMADNANHTTIYQLYQDQAQQRYWGDDNATINYPSEAGTGNGNPQTLMVYGSTSANVLNPAGTFTDTVTATLSF